MPTVFPPRFLHAASIAFVALATSLFDPVLPRMNATTRIAARPPADNKPAGKGRATVGSTAPDFQLSDISGKQSVRLSKLRGRPVVLWFGSYTCQPFRGSVKGMERLYSAERSNASFFIVYTREAHPDDADQPHIRKTRTTEERRKSALALKNEMRLSVPVLIDTMKDEVSKAYDAPGARIYVIDKAGKITYRTSVPAEAVEVTEAAQALQRIL